MNLAERMALAQSTRGGHALMPADAYMKKMKISSNCPWAQVPVALILDPNLGHAAFRLAAWLCSRPNGWKVRKENAKQSCQLGESAWDTASKQLSRAGYLTMTQLRVGGKFDQWEYIFDPQPSPDTGGSFSAHGLTAPGQTGAGRPAHLQEGVQKEGVTKGKPQPLHEHGGGGEKFEFPPCIAGMDGAAIQLMSGMPALKCQELLDELAGSRDVRNPLAWLRKMADKLKKGEEIHFELAAGVAAAREARIAHQRRLESIISGEQSAKHQSEIQHKPPSAVALAVRAKLAEKRAAWGRP